MAEHRPRGVKVETLQNGQRISCPTFSRVKACVFFLFAVVMAVSSAWVVAAVWSGDSRSEPVTTILITIPYARRRNVNVTSIQQVYIIRRESRYSFSYKLYALIRGGSHRHLLTVEDAQLALYLEEQIERALGMKDQVVRGEWRPEPYLWES